MVGAVLVVQCLGGLYAIVYWGKEYVGGEVDMVEKHTWEEPMCPEKEAELLREHVEKIKKSGTMKVRQEQVRELGKIHDRLIKERPTLKEKHPRKWVAVGKAGVVTLGDSQEEVLVELKRLGLRSSDVMIDFLDSDPPIHIL